MTWTTITLKESNDRILKAIPSLNQLELLNYVYVSTINKFVNTKDISLQLTPAQFDEMYQGYVPSKNDSDTPSKIIREINKETNVVYTIDMFPAKSETIVEIGHGLKALNLCATRRKFSFEGQLNKPTIFLNHIEYLFDGNKQAVEYILKWIAHLIFKPETKMTTGLMLSGGQGTGKTTFTDIVSNLVGLENAISISPDDIKSQFSNWMEGNRLAVVEEIHENNNYALYNKIKPYFTNSKINMNTKHENAREIHNHLHFILLSNYANPLPLGDDDRRIFYLHSKAKKRDRDYYKKLNQYLKHSNNTFKQEALNEIAKYLKEEILPKLEDDFAYTEPYLTEDKIEAGLSSEHPIKTWVKDGLESKKGLFEDGVWFLWKDLIASLPQEFNHIKRNTGVVSSVLKSCGLVRVRHTVNSIKQDTCWFEKSTSYLDWKDTSKQGRKNILGRQRIFSSPNDYSVDNETWTVNMDTPEIYNLNKEK